MSRAKPTPVLTPPKHGAFTYKAGSDGMTHSAEYVVQYGTRKFTVSAKRRLLPAAPGKRRKDSELVAGSHRYLSRAQDYRRVEVPLPPAVHAAVLEHFAGLVKGSAPSKNAKRVTMRQVGGDDGYCWAVMVDGVAKWQGMQRGEASWRRDAEVARLDAGERGPADVTSAEDVQRLQRNLRESVLDNAISPERAQGIVRKAAAELRAD